MDGFERFAGGQLITVFSATDYCGKHKNAGTNVNTSITDKTRLTKTNARMTKLIMPFFIIIT